VRKTALRPQGDPEGLALRSLKNASAVSERPDVQARQPLAHAGAFSDTDGLKLKHKLLQIAGSALVIWLLFAVCTAQTSSPISPRLGFFRVQLGDDEIVALNDGIVSYPISRVLPTATPEAIANGISSNGVSDPLAMSYNAFLIRTATRLVLIDTGTGGKLDNDPSFHGCGHLSENLRAAGFRPEQIDEVLITHRGQDHTGGLTSLDGTRRMFPNAIVHVPKDEFSMVLNAGETEPYINRARNKDFARSWIDFTTSVFATYVSAGKLLAFEGDITMAPGIAAQATHGHTPGHTSYIVESKGQTLIVMGDLVLVSGLQFHDPDLGSSFDSDPKAAAEQRRRILALAAARGYWIAGSHLPFPGIGQVRAAGNGFSFSPAGSNSVLAPPR
jgi:glyoxylase-like metal-dependent hydrolase (beta-lactamase superfamily II)